MTSINLLNHELFLKNRDDLEVVVSLTDGQSLEAWNRISGELLETFNDDAEASDWVWKVETTTTA